MELRPTSTIRATSSTSCPCRTGTWKSTCSERAVTTVRRAYRVAAMKAALSIQANARPPNNVPRWLASSGNTISHRRASHGAPASSERIVESHRTADADLIRGHATFEEVGELLHVLQIHEREWILRA